MKRILCIWLPNWPIQRLVVARPELSCQRIILFQQHRQRGQLVSAASSRALATGVRLDMPLSEAKSLCERVPLRGADVKLSTSSTPPASSARPLHGSNGAASSSGTVSASGGLHFFEHEPILDHEQLEALALGCEHFSPIVGIEQADSPSSILLEVSGLAHLFHGEQQLGLEIQKHFEQQGYTAQLAIAPTLGMAWACARHADLFFRAAQNQETPECVLGADSELDDWVPEPFLCEQVSAAPEKETGDPEAVAKDLPIRIQGPGGDLALPESAFDTLPIAALRLSDNTVDTLEQLGVLEIGQISQLPREGLRSRFGDELTNALDRATGDRDEVVIALQRPAEFSVEQFLEYPVGDRETIETILSRQVTDLCRQMAAQQRGSLAWHFELTGPNHSRLNFQVHLFQPAVTSEHVMQLAKMQLEQNQSYCQLERVKKRQENFQKQAGAKPRRKRRAWTEFCFQSFTVSIPSTQLLAQRQTHLFDTDAQPGRQSLSHLVNSLSSRLGAENVLRARLQAGASAEHAARFERLVGPSETSLKTKTPIAPAPAISPLERPLRLLPQPVPLEPWFEPDSSSRLQNSFRSRNLPAGFSWERNSFRVLRRWGPERIETRWWNAPTTRRDYWRIETSDARWLWVFRDLRSRTWFVHGMF